MSCSKWQVELFDWMHQSYEYWNESELYDHDNFLQARLWSQIIQASAQESSLSWTERENLCLCVIFQYDYWEICRVSKSTCSRL